MITASDLEEDKSSAQAADTSLSDSKEVFIAYYHQDSLFIVTEKNPHAIVACLKDCFRFYDFERRHREIKITPLKGSKILCLSCTIAISWIHIIKLVTFDGRKLRVVNTEVLQLQDSFDPCFVSNESRQFLAVGTPASGISYSIYEYSDSFIWPQQTQIKPVRKSILKLEKPQYGENYRRVSSIDMTENGQKFAFIDSLIILNVADVNTGNILFSQNTTKSPLYSSVYSCKFIQAETQVVAAKLFGGEFYFADVAKECMLEEYEMRCSMSSMDYSKLNPDLLILSELIESVIRIFDVRMSKKKSVDRLAFGKFDKRFANYDTDDSITNLIWHPTDSNKILADNASELMIIDKRMTREPEVFYRYTFCLKAACFFEVAM